ncbi:MAG: hypothetical protein FWF59_03015 [Turicibacter sp.]|nr:hypothetical protein [Turicibacter sp.]
MQMNRVMIFLYDLLVAFAFGLQFTVVGPYINGSASLFWLLAGIFALSVIILSIREFFHPSPLEIVSYHINLIMRHLPEDADESYDHKNQLYLSDNFLESDDYQFFYYGDCCAKLDKYQHMKIKLAIGPDDFNDVEMIIQTMDEHFIRFHLIKETDNPFLAFLYGWVIEEVKYSDHQEFLELVDG